MPNKRAKENWYFLRILMILIDPYISWIIMWCKLVFQGGEIYSLCRWNRWILWFMVSQAPFSIISLWFYPHGISVAIGYVPIKNHIYIHIYMIIYIYNSYRSITTGLKTFCGCWIQSICTNMSVNWHHHAVFSDGKEYNFKPQAIHVVFLNALRFVG